MQSYHLDLHKDSAESLLEDCSSSGWSKDCSFKDLNLFVCTTIWFPLEIISSFVTLVRTASSLYLMNIPSL